MDIDLTGSKAEIEDLIALIRGCPSCTQIRVSSFDRLSTELYSCRIEYIFDGSVPGGSDSPNVFSKYQRALSSQKGGGYAGGRPPYGYRAENGTYLINEKEAEAVRDIFDMRSHGMTLSAIAEQLNQKGYPTRSGRKWHYTSIQSILQSRNTYLGYYHYGDKTPWVKGTHASILNSRIYHPDFEKEGYKAKDDSSRIMPLKK